MDREAIDLNLPAFGPKAQKIEEASVEEAPKAEEPKVEEKVEDESSVEENKVPYSRFKNVSLARREAEKEAAEWKARAEELERGRSERTVERQDSDTPTWWTELYGDNEQAKRAYGIWAEHQPALSKEDIRKEAIEAYREEQQTAEAAKQKNLARIDDNLEEISALAGHDLTEQEQSALLDIIDEYTPKDPNGSYAGGLLEPDKAWEIYELKNQSAQASRKQSRDNAAGAINARSNGETSLDAQERDKNFVPQAWGQWRNRFK